MDDQRDCRNRPGPGHRSTAIAGALASEAAKGVEQAAAPSGDRVVGGEELKIADRARPLKRAEHDVVGIGGRLTAEKFLALDCPAQWHQAFAERRQPRIAVPDDL